MKQLNVIVPYRNRESHLRRFIPALEKYLESKDIQFSVSIVEQLNNKLTILSAIAFGIAPDNKNLSISLMKITKKLEKEYKIKIDYLEFRNLKDLRISNFKSKYKLFVAYHIGKVRLIDNF